MQVIPLVRGSVGAASWLVARRQPSDLLGSHRILCKTEDALGRTDGLQPLPPYPSCASGSNPPY